MVKREEVKVPGDTRIFEMHHSEPGYLFYEPQYCCVYYIDRKEVSRSYFYAEIEESRFKTKFNNIMKG